MFAALETKRSARKNETFSKSLFSKKFRPGFAGVCSPPGDSPLQYYLNGLRTSSEGHSCFLFSLGALGRCATAFRFLAYAASVNALYAVTLCALTRFPRKARRDPTYAFVLEASLCARAHDTPPFAYALQLPR